MAFTFAYKMREDEKLGCSYLASFPGLLFCFYVPFVFAIIHKSGRLAKN